MEVPNSRVNIAEQLSNVNVEDLEYIEADLCFHEKISIAFLLFAIDKVNAQFILQKLLVISNSQNSGAVNEDILSSFARINSNWKISIIEALSIIKARRVLRKLGFEWDEIKHHFLPHIPEISLNIHPILKVLYVMCEKLKPAQAGKMVIEFKEKHPDDHLQFHDFAYLEIFLLNWMTRGIINVNKDQQNDLSALLDYFKLNDMHDMKDLLLAPSKLKNKNLALKQPCQASDDSGINCVSNNKCRDLNQTLNNKLSLDESYSVKTETAGIILIINQQRFYKDSDAELQHFIPKKDLGDRKGTNADKSRLRSVFSSFGYIPLEFDNLTHIKMLSTIRDTVKRSILYDSLIVCILTHGFEGYVYGANSVPVKIADIEKIIAEEYLQGKPKMLIIQSCQKDEKNTDSNSNSNAVSNICPLSYRDMVKAMSTVPGYASIRDTEKGTWFVQSICDSLDVLGDRKHILDILTAATRDVSSKRGDNNEVMVPLTSHTLIKDFFLPKRLK